MCRTARRVSFIQSVLTVVHNAENRWVSAHCSFSGILVISVSVFRLGDGDQALSKGPSSRCLPPLT
jgi:hypothetical protein